jgi:nitric oxide reductase activation protein
VVKARTLFFARAGLPSTHDCRAFGSLLGNDVGQMRLSFDAKTYVVEPIYRDDHRLLWEPSAASAAGQGETRERAVLQSTSLPNSVPTDSALAVGTRTAGERIGGTDGQAADDAWITPVRYPEWDYQIGTMRPDYCAVRESTSRASIDEPKGDNGRGSPEPVAGWIERFARSLRMTAPHSLRRQHEGEALDMDATLEARVDLRVGRTPDGRVYVRTSRRCETMAVLLLLDLSASTATTVPTFGLSVLDLARNAALLLGQFFVRSGNPFAVHGFSSNGHDHVEYHRFKDFADRWDAQARSRLARAAPRLSTRMGGALRHAARHVSGVPCDRRLIVLLTDGEPSDIDVYDPAYLGHDTRHAVGELLQRGVHVFAVSLDAASEGSIRRIFGEGRYRVFGRVAPG